MIFKRKYTYFFSLEFFVITIFFCTHVYAEPKVQQVSCSLADIDIRESGDVWFGTSHTAILKDDGSLWMSGSNDHGELGNGASGFNLKELSFKKIMTNVKQISCGEQHTAILKKDGSLWTTGYNHYGQLGTGSTQDTSIPTKILDNVKYIYAKWNYTAIIKNDGTLWITGHFFPGNKISSKPVYVMNNVKMVSGGQFYLAVIKADNSLWIMGDNSFGQSGNGKTTYISSFTKIMDNVKYISCGTSHTVILKTDGTLWATGNNHHGQLGDGTSSDKYSPVKIMTNVIDIDCGPYFTAILKKDKSLWMVGHNRFGQLGNGLEATLYTPVKILDNVKSVSCGSTYTAIIKTDNSLWMTGNNSYGQFGNGTITSQCSFINILNGSGSTGKSLTKATISGIQASYTYTGKKITPVPTVKYGSTTLKKDTDYTVSYSNNIKVGTATIKITGKGNYIGSKSVTFKIVKKTVKITFNPNGGATSKTSVSIQAGKAIGTLPTATRKGYEFVGWYTKKTGGNKISASTIVNKDITYYAHWEKEKKYTVSFDANGGETITTTLSLINNQKYGDLPKPTRKGYSFKGWYTAKKNGKKVISTTIFTLKKDCKLYALWKPVVYSITYVMPEGMSIKGTYKTTYTIETDTFKLPTQNEISMTGYSFSGWSTSSTQDKPIFAITKGTTGNKTLYARTVAYKYTISFRPGEGSGSMNSLNCTYGQEYTLPQITFTPPNGYEFNYWKCKETQGTYKNGEKIKNLSSESAGVVTLEAQWKKTNDLLAYYQKVTNYMNEWNANPQYTKAGSSYGAASQCAAFSRYIFYQLYGHYDREQDKTDKNILMTTSSGNYIHNGNELKSFLKNKAAPGDALRINLVINGVVSKTQTHIVHFYDIDSDRIKVFESNYNGGKDNKARYREYTNFDQLLINWTSCKKLEGKEFKVTIIHAPENQFTCADLSINK